MWMLLYFVALKPPGMLLLLILYYLEHDIRNQARRSLRDEASRVTRP